MNWLERLINKLFGIHQEPLSDVPKKSIRKEHREATAFDWKYGKIAKKDEKKVENKFVVTPKPHTINELKLWAEEEGVKKCSSYRKDSNGNYRSLELLYPDFKPVVKKFVTECNKTLKQLYPNKNITVAVINTFRTPEMQDKEYAVGRTEKKTKKTVTNAKRWQSLHCYGLAIDCYPKSGNRFLFDADKDRDVYAAIVKIGRKYFGSCGADWKDYGHFAACSYEDFKDKGEVVINNTDYDKQQ